jgi:crotonobetainyl-CoA:carnitine CoA-transferase CaiB-like acyl-CoA transferase
MMGQHTDAILTQWLAIAADEIAKLRERGVV